MVYGVVNLAESVVLYRGHVFVPGVPQGVSEDLVFEVLALEGMQACDPPATNAAMVGLVVELERKPELVGIMLREGYEPRVVGGQMVYAGEALWMTEAEAVEFLSADNWERVPAEIADEEVVEDVSSSSDGNSNQGRNREGNRNLSRRGDAN